MPEPAEPHAIKWAEFPQRRCRIPFSLDGLIDHTCDLPELHPGPDASISSPASADRRRGWELAHPGWESLAGHDDPFADFTEKLKEQG